MEACERANDMTMLRALYLSWRKITFNETKSQLYDEVLQCTLDAA